MSYPQTVRDVLLLFDAIDDTFGAAEALGIDPDMPVETFKRRLLWGERVETTAGTLPVDPMRHPVLALITREEA